MPAPESFLPPVFGLAAVLYLALAANVSRSSPRSAVPFLLYLMGIMVLGTAFTFGASDFGLFNIGRVLNFFAAAFLPIAFYGIYRQYTSNPPNPPKPKTNR